MPHLELANTMVSLGMSIPRKMSSSKETWGIPKSGVSGTCVGTIDIEIQHLEVRSDSIFVSEFRVN